MGIDKGVNAVNDAIEKVISVAVNKKEFLFKQIINIILVFIILLVFGCLDFATLTFHFEYLGSVNFWGQVLTKTIAAVCSFNIGINLMLDTEIKKDTILAENIVRYENLNKYKQKDFEYFIRKIYNPKSKKANYIATINRQIYLLNKFSKRRDRLLYSSDLPERQEEKLKNKYCIKRNELEMLKTDDFIVKNLESLNVKYTEVDPAIFELEIDGSNKVGKDKVRGSIAEGRLKASANVILGSFIFPMFFSSFGLTADGQEFANNMVAFWHYCLKVATDLFIIIFQLISGMGKVRGIISSQLTVPYSIRNKILMQYYEWRDSQGLEIPNYYREITTIKNDEIIEISEEDLKKLKELQ